MKVAPYFGTPHKKKDMRMRKGRQTRTRNTIKREEQSRVEKKWMRDRETIWGDRGEGLATATLSHIKKMCCSLFSLASLFSHSFCHSLFLSFSLPPCPGRSSHWSVTVRKGGGKRGLRDGRREVVLSSPLCLSSASRTKTLTLLLRAFVCLVCVRTNINKHARLFTNDSAVNNLNSFTFGNSFSFRLLCSSCEQPKCVEHPSYFKRYTHTHVHTKTRKCTFTGAHILTEGITLPYSGRERERERDRGQHV